MFFFAVETVEFYCNSGLKICGLGRVEYEIELNSFDRQNFKVTDVD